MSDNSELKSPLLSKVTQTDLMCINKETLPRKELSITKVSVLTVAHEWPNSNFINACHRCVYPFPFSWLISFGDARQADC